MHYTVSDDDVGGSEFCIVDKNILIDTLNINTLTYNRQ